jgi:hypothetical protein
MSGLLQTVRKWMRDQEERQYLDQLDDQALMDCGVSRADFLTAIGAPKDTRARMDAMARAHGLPVEAIDSERWRALDMARACSQCGDRQMCKRWLMGVEDEVGAEAFCPNSEHFAELALQYGVKSAARGPAKKGRGRKVCGYI